jgi:hypothetical protein
VTGTSSGALNLSETASGGGGGAVYSQNNLATNGVAGAGGAASATMTTADSTASSVVTSVIATGGGGGATDYGTPGAGGSATATLSVSSSSASSVSGTATANGGAGGIYTNAIPFNYAAGGNASATAVVSATASGASGNATANATGGYGSGPETATATATVTSAASGLAQATSESQGPLGTVVTSASAPVGGLASAVTEANISSPLQAVALAPGEAYATAELTPGGSSFGLGGFGAESDGSSTSITYDATADFTFLTNTTEDIFLNLTSGLGSLPAGDSFSLVFSYDINGEGVVNSPTFTSLAAADAYFNGMAIDLGSFGAGTQSLDLTYAFTAMGDPPSYEITYDIAGTSVTPTVPEPSTWAMMLIGFGGLGYMSWRRVRREAKPVGALTAAS